MKTQVTSRGGLVLSAVVLALIALGSTPAAAKAQRLKERSIKACRAAYQVQADAGIAWYQNELAACLSWLKESDPKELLALYEKAAKAGNGVASFNAGKVYYLGIGVDKDIPRAIAMYEQSWSRGFVKSCVPLTEIYADSSNTPVYSEARSREWALRGARRNHPRCATYLSSKFAAGRGGPTDFPAANHWARFAARLGDGAAMHQLSKRYLQGEGLKKDDASAFAFLLLAARHGDADAVKALPLAERQVPVDVRCRGLGLARAWLDEALGPADLVRPMTEMSGSVVLQCSTSERDVVQSRWYQLEAKSYENHLKDFDIWAKQRLARAGVSSGRHGSYGGISGFGQTSPHGGMRSGGLSAASGASGLMRR